MGVEDKLENDMQSAKEKARSLVEQMSDDCTFEDIQYQLFVAEKIQRGIERAAQEGALSQNEIEEKFRKWTSA